MNDQSPTIIQHPTYDTPITDDVIGRLEPFEVGKTLDAISRLEPAEAAA